MSWLEKRIEAVVTRLAREGRLVVFQTVTTPVPCAACSGTGRSGAVYQRVAIEGDRETCGLRDVMLAAQGVCVACGGAGVIVPRHATREYEEKRNAS